MHLLKMPYNSKDKNFGMLATLDNKGKLDNWIDRTLKEIKAAFNKAAYVSVNLSS
jgi:hypothetical protein